MAMITISTIKERWKLSITASFMGCIIPVLFLNHSHDSTNLSALLGIRMEPSEPSKLNKHSDSALQNTSTSPTSFGQFPTPNVEFSQISKLTGFPDSAPQIMNTSVLFSEPPRPNTEFSEPSKPKMEFSGPSKLTDYPSSALQNTTTSTLSF
ncbi:hypothetical protein CK203_048072 [Vitis vinifera]|uniref:Uncharacterized protein n=2 Tax=Vitis TaxID=3603 RepID=A0A438GZ26_VITVI|nr:hypothetical protein CK203_048072 [Vitis vinifera]